MAGTHSRDLNNKNSNSMVDVIVQFTAAPNAQRDQKVPKFGGTKKNRNLGFISAGAYSLPAAAIASLEQDPEVVYISLDRPSQATLNLASSAIGVSRGSLSQVPIFIHLGGRAKRAVGIDILPKYFLPCRTNNLPALTPPSHPAPRIPLS
jgi:hypothetical protein